MSWSTTYCQICEDDCADEDGQCETCIQRDDARRACRHGIEHECAVCNGAWDWNLTSKVTGIVYSSWESTPVFVPTVTAVRQPTHPVAVADRRRRSDNGCPGEGDGEPDAAIRTHTLEGRVRRLPDLGKPRWYREQVLGEPTLSELSNDLGLDYWGMLEQHLADVADSLLEVGEIWPSHPAPDLPPYPIGGTVEEMRSWRAVGVCRISDPFDF